MLEVDRSEFARFLPAYIGKNAETETMRRWWRALEPFDLSHIKTAFVQRDQEKGGYPEPIQIVERCRVLSGPVQNNSQPLEHPWTRSDLLIACQMKVVFPKNWQEKVTQAYDAMLAETVSNVLERFPQMLPADAAREHFKQHPAWVQVRSNAVPM